MQSFREYGDPVYVLHLVLCWLILSSRILTESLRWERFEELLEEAQSTRDYDVTLAINQMVDFLLSPTGAPIRQQLSVQIVDQVDQLGVDALTFARKNVGQVGAKKNASI